MRNNIEVPKGKEKSNNNFYYFMLFCLITSLFLVVNNTNTSAQANLNTPNDPLYSEQWHMHSSQDGTTTNWEGFYRIIEQTNIEPLTAVRVALIDGSLNLDHPDLVSNVEINHDDPINGEDDDQDGYEDNYRGCAFTPEDDSCTDVGLNGSMTQHATGTAGVFAAVTDNQTGISGASHGIDLKFVPLKAVQDSGYANYSDIYEALLYVFNDGNFDVVIINIAGWPNQGSVQHIDDLITQIYEEQGTIFVAGSGNSAANQNSIINEGSIFVDNPENINAASTETTVGWPARHPNVIAVGGTNQDGNRRPSANYGPELVLSAPAEWISTLCYENSTCFQSGTSFSGPQVGSAVAFIRAYLPDASFEEVEAILQNSAKGEYSLELGHGILDFEALASEILLTKKIYLPIVSN